MSLSQPIITVLQAFASAFSQPTWSTVQVLMVGTLLARGRRTVAAALRQMGLRTAPHFSLYPHGLNRAPWSALALRRRLLVWLVRTFGHTRSCSRSSHAGPWKRPSRRADPIVGSKRSGSGRIAPSSAPRPVWSVSTRWWCCRLMRGIPMARFPCTGRPGTPSPRRRLPRCWPLSVGIDGVGFVMQHPHTPQTL
jgi:DDE superfamily endonuclease